MRKVWMFVGAGALLAGVAYFPACSPGMTFMEDAGTTCKDAGNGQGEGCPCDPNKFKPRGCFEAPPANLKGACKSGMRSCNPDGTQSACVGQILPEMEVCNGIDDDCNGAVDDISSNEPILKDYAEAGLDPPIEAGAQCFIDNEIGLCAAGRYGCNSMGVKGCIGMIKKDPDSGLSPYTEICNGIDDDCDGMEDNVSTNGMKCTVTYEDGGSPKGECANGTQQCISGVDKCVGQTPTMGDTCDGKDNDCDGQYDEGPTNACPCSMCTKGQWCCVSSGTLIQACYTQNPGVQQWSCYQKP